MTDYGPVARRLARSIEPLGRARREALDLSREMVRLAGTIIRDLHRGASDARAARELEGHTQKLRRLVARFPYLEYHGGVLQGFQEYVEAKLLAGFLEGDRVVSPRRLRVPPAAFLLGLGDLVGELRRVALARLLADDLAGARRAFDSMEKTYEALLDCHVPESMVPLRTKVDAARAIVDRTRGDLVTAKESKDLEKKIDGISRLLDDAEQKPAKRARRREADELDLDSAWSKG